MANKKPRRGAFASLSLRPAPKGREVDARAQQEVSELLGNESRARDMLIEHLHKLQDRYRALTPEHLTALAYELRLTPAEVYEVATFYHHFDVVRDGDQVPPEITVRVCESIACHLAGGEAMIDQLRARLGENVRVIAAPCIGQCDSAPAALVNRNPVRNATVDSLEAAVRDGQTEPTIPPYIEYNSYREQGGYQILADCVNGKHKVQDIIATLAQSGLRGLGGAGFPSAKKWQFVRDEPAPRYTVMNADEGEPGTFKDRFCLESDPHRVLEGLLIASWVIESQAVYIYLRDEYATARAILTRELAALQENPPCPLPPIILRRGAGAYICGEETALIESLEGKRGEPRLRPPFPAQRGLFDRPTLVHNVETAYWLREIIEHGAHVFVGNGVNDRTGKRYFSVSGRVARPGVYLAPNGVTVRDLIYEYAGGMLPGHELYGFLPGGASGGILPTSLADHPLDFDVLAQHGSFIGSAAIIVFSDRDQARDIALNITKFFAHESCGKCTPCRQGTAKKIALLEQPKWDLPLLNDLGTAMMDASICGLGQAAPNPVRSVQRFFAQELEPE